MKLKETIKNIEEKIKGWSKPDLYEYAKDLWPKYMGDVNETSVMAIMTNVINSYLNEVFLSKNEGAFWLKSIDCEMQELRQRIEDLESEKEALALSLEERTFSNPGFSGLSDEDIRRIDQMISDEYFGECFDDNQSFDEDN